MDSAFIYRQGHSSDLPKLKALGLAAWSGYHAHLTEENWKKLQASLEDDKTYAQLLSLAQCLVCSTSGDQLIGMAFLVPSGNPTDIYHENWSYIRYVSVHPDFAGHRIGRQLTQDCLARAAKNGESVVALHTSELMNKARHIYESLGFQVLRELEPRLGVRYWLYTKRL